MGEYMDKYMNEWYIQYCRFSMSIKHKEAVRNCLLQGHGKIL